MESYINSGTESTAVNSSKLLLLLFLMPRIQLPICWSDKQVYIAMTYETDWTVARLLEYVTDSFNLPGTHVLVLCISNYGGCCDDKLLTDYLSRYSLDSMCILLRSQTPKDTVRNYRIFHRLSGNYTPVEKCMVCHSRQPNVANSDCNNHDSVLCY